MLKLDTPLAFLQVLVALGLLFFASIPLSHFSSAMTPDEAIEQGYPPMPDYWEAGTYGHGSYTKWVKAENHPFAYSFSLVVFFGAFLYFLYASNTYKKVKSGDGRL